MTSDADHKSRVLVVDDEPDTLVFIEGVLEQHSYGVIPVTSGTLALEVIERETPDVILMDIDMPGMDGFETCRRIKMQEGTRAIPVIFVSARTWPGVEAQAFRSGGVDYLTKPFKIDEVVARIDTHVSRERVPREWECRFEELKKLERLREKLTQMVVHDMRGPLAVISGSIDLALANSQSELGEEGVRLLKLGRSQAEVIGRMMADMLEVGLLEEGEMPVNRSDCDFVDILTEAVSMVVLDDRKLIVDAPVSPCIVEWDRYLMRRALSNLIRNAVMSTGDGGEVHLKACRGVNAIRVEVTNPGPGVAPENQERAMEKFGGIEAPTSCKAPLTGLGLTFCRMAIEAHGGRLGLRSGPEMGTTFWFVVPPNGRPGVPKILSYISG